MNLSSGDAEDDKSQDVYGRAEHFERERAVDADVDRETWQAMFARAVDKTFNRVSVDGDTSTNDTILGLANGASGIRAEGEDAALLE